MIDAAHIYSLLYSYSLDARKWELRARYAEAELKKARNHIRALEAYKESVERYLDG